jgi:hypothetical protein
LRSREFAFVAGLLAHLVELGAFLQLVRKTTIRADLVANGSFAKSQTERFSNFQVKFSNCIDFTRRDFQQLAIGDCDYVPRPNGLLENTLGPEKSLMGEVNIFRVGIVCGPLRKELTFNDEEHGIRHLPGAYNILSALRMDHTHLAAEVAKGVSGDLRKEGMPFHHRDVELFADLLAEGRRELIEDLLIGLVRDQLCLVIASEIVKRSGLQQARDLSLDHEVFEQRFICLYL